MHLASDVASQTREVVSTTSKADVMRNAFSQHKAKVSMPWSTVHIFMCLSLSYPNSPECDRSCFVLTDVAPTAVQ
ncbi:hypothetical protein PISMIDRAFT_564782 [Pisolithus microcarpus 441]|uniref:Uncharacterized protein n=1 Tax=Pisolithus microcarpus 441 TaxID=765257 RepID=A0A0C9Y8W0_9AGAM|nr:hypothetical protein PISMIDRAFT_564782 [Pisolithus microcarpus 441]